MSANILTARPNLWQRNRMSYDRNHLELQTFIENHFMQERAIGVVGITKMYQTTFLFGIYREKQIHSQMTNL